MELYRRAREVLPFVFTFIRTDEGPCARHASRALRRACGQGAVLSLCMVRPGSGRFGVGFWVGFWVGLRARDFPTERVLSRTPLIIRTVDQLRLCPGETLHRECSGLTTTCGCLFGFVCKKKPTKLERFSREESSQRAPPFFLWMLGV